MKRIVTSLCGAALLLGMAGCESGTGGGAGLPADRSEPVPVNLPKTDMAAGKVNLNRLKSVGPETAPTAEPEKK